jgi:hypothetical protein
MLRAGLISNLNFEGLAPGPRRRGGGEKTKVLAGQQLPVAFHQRFLKVADLPQTMRPLRNAGGAKLKAKAVFFAFPLPAQAPSSLSYSAPREYRNSPRLDHYINAIVCFLRISC